MTKIISNLPSDNDYSKSYDRIIDEFNSVLEKIMESGGKLNIQKQHSKKRLTARERINYLIDDETVFFELCRFSAYDMYEEYGGANCAGVVTGIGKVSNEDVLIIANDELLKPEHILR